MLTSWNDLSRVIYSLREVWVFYVMYDDTRIINVKHLKFKSDSQVFIFAFSFICFFLTFYVKVLHIEGAGCIPSLYHNYMCQPLTNAIVSNVPRVTVGIIIAEEEVFSRNLK